MVSNSRETVLLLRPFYCAHTLRFLSIKRNRHQRPGRPEPELRKHTSHFIAFFFCFAFLLQGTMKSHHSNALIHLSWNGARAWSRADVSGTYRDPSSDAGPPAVVEEGPPGWPAVSRVELAGARRDLNNTVPVRWCPAVQNHRHTAAPGHCCSRCCCACKTNTHTHTH